jgi:hypothetical protein
MAAGGFVVQNKWAVYYYSEQWDSNIFHPLSLASSPAMFRFSPENITMRYQHEKENRTCITFCSPELRIHVNASRVTNVLQLLLA